MEKFLLVILCAFVYTASAYPVSDCGSTLGKLLKLSVSSCKAQDPICQIPRGSNVTVDIDFIPFKEESQILTVVTALADGSSFDLPVPQPDACLNCGLVCPVKPGNTYRYTLSVPIPSDVPQISLTIQYELANPITTNDIVCLLFPVQLL
ncbi:hypothetical protein L9F63_020255 [Diploptera punctata]|uniref:MD-2-related lipid-recognition domain-containing protein n=1 Tax=Diploptera punctata TaxID=6984 RepID=A0AAD7ZUH8_DIPPU|nr:hypothetical protein L9F63_020255 [Diploptera punctata]